MKILKNNSRKNKIIKNLKKRHHVLWGERNRNENNVDYLLKVAAEANEEANKYKKENVELKAEIKELLDIKGRHYNLLKVIDITDEIKKILKS